MLDDTKKQTYHSQEAYDAKTESIDKLFDGKFSVIQSKQGYRYTLDSFLLSAFFGRQNSQKIADLGSGSGIISFLISELCPESQVYGIELQKALVNTAKKTLRINESKRNINIINCDLRKIDKFLQEQSFDAAVSNPPFYPLGSGRLNPLSEKAVARHELMLSAPELLDAAWYILKPGGTLAVVYPAERLENLSLLFKLKGFCIRTLRYVKPHEGSSPSLFLALLEKSEAAQNKPNILAPLVVHGMVSVYSCEVRNILKLFGVDKKKYS